MICRYISMFLFTKDRAREADNEFEKYSYSRNVEILWNGFYTYDGHSIAGIWDDFTDHVQKYRQGQ